MYRNVKLFAVTMVIITLELWYIFKDSIIKVSMM